MRRATASAALGGLAHLVVPLLFVLPQDPNGPTVGVPATTYGVWVIGGTALAGVVMLRFLPTLGRLVILAAALLSGFLIGWEFRAFVLALTAPLLVSVWLLFVPDSGTEPGVESRRAVLAGIGGAAISSYLIWRMLGAYNERHTPSHPESVATKPVWEADWLWLGGVGATTAQVCAGGLGDGTYSLTYWVPSSGEQATVVTSNTTNGVARFELVDLVPATTYDYAVHSTSGLAGANASFTTPHQTAQNLTIAFGSCARTGSNGAVFDAIRATEPDLFVQLGDLHYGNLTSNQPADHITMLGRSLSTPAQAALYSSVPSMWIWDDHDFGPNDSDSSSPAREGALGAYRQAVPHWGVDPDTNKPINQAMTMGRVRVLTTDTRSMRTPSSMLGAEQEAWLINEVIESSRTHALVVWANPTPWNFPEVSGSDVWGGFPEERRRIANAIAEANVTNLVMISGDWHLAAIDDGTNTSYADDGSPGFPLIHAAPLDRPGSRTNDPYSHGVFSNAGQFGTIEVTDNGGAEINVVLAAHLWTGERLGELSLSMPVW